MTLTTGWLINRAKFDACSSSSFRGVETGTQTDRIALYRMYYKLSIVFESVIYEVYCIYIKEVVIVITEVVKV